MPRFGLLPLAGCNGFKFRQSGAASITYNMGETLDMPSHPPGQRHLAVALRLVLGLAVVVHVVLVALSVVPRRHLLGSFALSFYSVWAKYARA